MTYRSAQDVMENYSNANFMPQKKAHDRILVLGNKIELNPMVSVDFNNKNQ